MDILEVLSQLHDLLPCLLFFALAVDELGLQVFDFLLGILRLCDVALVLHLQDVLLSLHVVDIRGQGDAVRAILAQASVVRAVRHAFLFHLSLI